MNRVLVIFVLATQLVLEEQEKSEQVTARFSNCVLLTSIQQKRQLPRAVP